MPEPPVSPLDATTERLACLRALVPEAFADGALDLIRLGEALGLEAVPGEERFGLDWPGKAAARRSAATPSAGALHPSLQDSVRFESARHALIEGDNLEVLKLLQASYAERIKVIYVDPPYNTGQDFVYPDDYKQPLAQYLQLTGQADASGRALTSRAETAGRVHSAWLSMMLPRLMLARRLLRPDGVLFISIDDHEVAHLRLLLDEVFGAENFVASLIWRKKVVRGRGAAHVIPQTEYVLIYAKEREALPPFSEPLTPEMLAAYTHSDERGPYKLIPLAKSGTRSSPRPNLNYPIEAPDGTMIPCPTHQWRWSRETLAANCDEVVFKRMRDGRWSVFTKQRLFVDGEERERTPTSYYDRATTTDGTEDLKRVFGRVVLDFPKPVRLVQDLITWATGWGSTGEDLVLDFFAGSGTTAQAVLAQNAADGGNRRFVLVQLPEPTGDGEFETIAAIARTRIARVLGPEEGCRAFRLGPAGTGEAPLGPAFEWALQAGCGLDVAIEPFVIEEVPFYRLGDLLVTLAPAVPLEIWAQALAVGARTLVAPEAAFEGDEARLANVRQLAEAQGVRLRCC